jgi:hypothetical protein
MTDSLIEKLDHLVEYHDILPVRVYVDDMKQGLTNSVTKCPGALAIARAIGDPDMTQVRIQVGHKMREHLSSRVVIRVNDEPNYKWIGWIVNSSSNSGFHPKQFDQGKQKLPGSMMIHDWKKEPVSIMSENARFLLNSSVYKNKERRATRPHNGTYRVYNQ